MSTQEIAVPGRVLPMVRMAVVGVLMVGSLVVSAVVAVFALLTLGFASRV